jgi:hypothetical protein
MIALGHFILVLMAISFVAGMAHEIWTKIQAAKVAKAEAAERDTEESTR